MHIKKVENEKSEEE